MNYSIEKLLDLPFYTEGPAIDREGNLFFTTLTGGKIYQKNQEGISSAWAEAACPNGQVVLPNGEHWICDSQNASVVRLSCTGQFVGNVIEGSCAGVSVRVPNDLVVDSEQNLYFTDSVRHHGKVCYLGNDGKEYIVAEGLDYPNGLVLGKDERCLYVAESYQNRIVKMALTEPGVMAGKPEVFADLPIHASNTAIGNLPDGLALDHKGNVWVAHYGMQAVQVLSAGGELLFTVDTQLPLTSNVCFMEDEPERQKLIITGGYGEPGPGAVLLLTVLH
ncbi:SMP-30/gluconolactonase/LRE family protein [Persicitalea jodogahamensis]|uniref:SMP-30/Gluconolactonase/LRE-like region domain-containing protein n=1 Tax=Persicitalea jodogahamensis TaxID=402147 RepID=A0A8J3DAE9_9BACT|nr:SMP-30/gluconolactonase/LRE family protein [Persicitalea jodogahamensis]GHB74037.1 hypothetical protein GCM10007390_30380 [Persicitalea jodogahamensis]